MNPNKSISSARMLYIPHGGGPLPLLGEPHHQGMVDFLHHITPSLGSPAAILVISAHWEEPVATITSATQPPLFYDYYGFPEEAYQIKYPAPGDPILAGKVFNALQAHGIPAKMDDKRGFDHGMFVPLKLMYPDASIPVVQLSLLAGLDPAEHIRMGNALADLQNENILILGSGFSFHNMNAFFYGRSADGSDPHNEAFQRWLIQTCTVEGIDKPNREERLINWESAPYARYCHPREEHLLPLHVCAGISDAPGKLVFEGEVIGKKAIAVLW
ncbi:MAG: dioxygenase [Chloroflexi bacterium]|nr:dioxygenase [Chloroflexota bacterium]